MNKTSKTSLWNLAHDLSFNPDVGCFEKQTAEEIYATLLGRKVCTCTHSFLVRGCTCGAVVPHRDRRGR